MLHFTKHFSRTLTKALIAVFAWCDQFRARASISRVFYFRFHSRLDSFGKQWSEQ